MPAFVADITGPAVVDVPLVGSRTYFYSLFLLDDNGEPVNADSTPTRSVIGQGGADLTGNAGSVLTIETGWYLIEYTVADTHAETHFQVRFQFTIGGFDSQKAFGTAANTKPNVVHGRVTTALPDANPNASGGLLTFGTGDGQVNPGGDGTVDVGRILGQAPTMVEVATDTYALGVNVLGWLGDGVASFSTGIPSVGIANGGITAASIADGAITAAKAPNLDAAVSSRAAATIFSGITSLAQWLGLIAGKQTGNSTARTELRATGAGSGTYDETTDSLEAIKDNGVSVIGATSVEVTNPVDVSDGNRLNLVQGGSYTSGSYLPTWVIEDYSGPSLSGATYTLRLIDNSAYEKAGSNASADLSVSGSGSIDGTTITVTASITAEQTTALSPTYPPHGDEDTHKYELLATTSGGSPLTVPLLLGPCTVRREIKA